MSIASTTSRQPKSAHPAAITLRFVPAKRLAEHRFALVNTKNRVLPTTH